MNLYLRLIGLLLRCLFLKKDLTISAATVMTLRVWPNDLDLNGHMNNGRYLTIMDLGRLHLLHCKGLLTQVFKLKWQPVLGAAKIHYLKSLKPFSRYQLKTQVLYWDEKWIYLEQHFEQQGQLMATALVKALFVHRGQRLAPTALMQLVTPDARPTCPPCPAHLQRWIEAESQTKSERTPPTP